MQGLKCLGSGTKVLQNIWGSVRGFFSGIYYANHSAAGGRGEPGPVFEDWLCPPRFQGRGKVALSIDGLLHYDSDWRF